MLTKTVGLALTCAGRGGIHPLQNVDRDNRRPGLRRWVAVNKSDRRTLDVAGVMDEHPP